MENVLTEENLQHPETSRSRRRWHRAFDGLPNWLFAPEPEPLSVQPGRDVGRDPATRQQGGGEDNQVELGRLRGLLNERKASHDEMSKTIRRVFYALVSACLFCIVTLTGTPDTEVLTPETEVKLPALNYDMGLEAFLWVGPIILIALTVYLHIFVGQHRRLDIAPESRHPMLPNFSAWTPQLAVNFIYYWMVPLTLAVFAWKVSPRSDGDYLWYATIGVALVMVCLQLRRCRQKWRVKAPAFLIPFFLIFCLGAYLAIESRRLDLFMADLSGKDLRGLNLSHADLSGADLTDADLRGADLSGAMLHEANLSGAELFKADLTEANLTGADLSDADLLGAVIKQYVLDQACGNDDTSLALDLTIRACVKSRQGGKYDAAYSVGLLALEDF
ncbi:MAG: pentapeptide repeat-containing protein [Pseudomonadota bacterium]